MNSSGDAAEQIVRLSLEGVEVAAKITGSAAKNIAVLIYTLLKNKDKNKIKGRQRLEGMLRSGKELRVFPVSEDNLKMFAEEAKRYGIVYCALRNKGKSIDGMVDIMVRVEDAFKINRIADRFKMATVDVATIKSEIIKSKEAKVGELPVPEKGIPDLGDDKLLDDLMGKAQQKESNVPLNPEAAKTAKSRPSEPISEKPSKSAEGTTNSAKNERPSVREELRTIKAERQQTADKQKREDKSKSQKSAPAKKPPTPKKKKTKER